MTVVAGTAALLWGIAASFGAGIAIAGPLIGTCGGAVQGPPGTPVAVSRGSVGLVEIGEVPAAGSKRLSAPRLPLVGEPACSVLATAVQAGNAAGASVQQGAEQAGSMVRRTAPAPAQPAPESSAPPQQAPAGVPAAGPPAPPAAAPPPVAPRLGPFLPANFATNTPPRSASVFSRGFYDYSQLLAARRLFARAPSPDLFGYSPGFGILGAEDSGAAQDVAAAGRAEALPNGGADRVALPVLVAVLMLSAVTAALVRSWSHGGART